ncbi:MAG: alpha/beta hydrolase, partial [Chloroflexi bacterium]|nr:alpha/beta hydrolase [Chloroflexota bacterium]
MDFATIDGVKIAYRETGSGFPLVFAHEFAGSMESWDQQVNYFARRYRVIDYTARGYTPSDV